MFYWDVACNSRGLLLIVYVEHREGLVADLTIRTAYTAWDSWSLDVGIYSWTRYDMVRLGYFENTRCSNTVSRTSAGKERKADFLGLSLPNFRPIAYEIEFIMLDLSGVLLQ